MHRAKSREPAMTWTIRFQRLFVAVLLFSVIAGVAEAQSSGCQAAQRAIGVAVGRSAPYFEPSLGQGSAGTSGAVLARGGLEFAARADLPIAGAWRTRIEGATANWRLERQIYSADFRQVIGTETVGDIDVRQITALVGRQGGRAPACGYALAGGGLYSLHYQDTSSRRPGFVLTAGVEFPGGPRGSIQLDAQLQLINTGSRYPIGSSITVDARVSAGWVYRF